MIVLTGAAGFIGSVIAGYLNKKGVNNLVLVDDMPNETQFYNLSNKNFITLLSTEDAMELDTSVEAVIHFGANSSTLEKDWKSIYQTNVSSTRYWHNFAKSRSAKFIFASSAAVYGNGEGPMNQYAFSKQLSEQEITDGVILRLFNVYGPNEYHKGRMASVVHHWYHQMEQYGHIKVFHDSDKYKRDFIYVEDVAKAVYYFLKNYREGLYDLGTGKGVSFQQVADSFLRQYGKSMIEYIDMPKDLQAQYQKNTEADVSVLEEAGFKCDSMLDIDNGIRQYLGYLKSKKVY
jgi:ADP-L-glycero-D-manno-heptose 6-epimerase